MTACDGMGGKGQTGTGWELKKKDAYVTNNEEREHKSI